MCDIEASGDRHRVEDVVAVVPRVRDAVGGEGGGEGDTRADVAGFAIGEGRMVPEWRRVGAVESVHGGILRQVCRRQFGELVHKEGFRLGLIADGLIGENGAFVRVIAEDGGDFDKIAGRKGFQGVVCYEVVVENGVVGEDGVAGRAGEGLRVCIGCLEGFD